MALAAIRVSDPHGTIRIMTRRPLAFVFDLRHEAKNLYGSEGPAGFSIRRLAKRIGASSAVMYCFWPSRDALLNVVANDSWESFRKDQRRHQDLKPARARLAALTSDAIDFALANPHLWDLMLEPKSARLPAIERVIALVYDAIMQASREEPLEPTAPPLRCAQGWLGLVAGMVRLHRANAFPEETLRKFCCELAGKIFGLS